MGVSLLICLISITPTATNMSEKSFWNCCKTDFNRSHRLTEITQIKSLSVVLQVKTSAQTDSPACTTAACTAIAPSRVAGIGDSEPRNKPIGVRTALAITTSYNTNITAALH